MRLVFRDTAMSKNDELRYGAPGETAVHLCVDMQRIFAEGTEWKMPWLERVLPNILSITSPSGKDDLHPLHPGAQSRARPWGCGGTTTSAGDR